jgi:uncharacterized Zn-finger protein
MQRSAEPMGPSSFTARRSAAQSLPSFELPPPPLAALHNKYQPYSSALNNSQSSAPSGAGNLLTPPNTVPSDSLSPTTQNNNGGTQALGSYAANSYWPQTQSSQYGYSSGNTPQQWIPPRGMFSPGGMPGSINSIVQNSNNSGNQDNRSHYEMNQLPPFPSSLSMSGNMPPVQSHQAMMNAQSSQSQYGGPNNRPPPTPTYSYGSSNSANTPNQPNFPYSGPSPTQSGQNTLGMTQQQITPASSSDSVPTLQHMNSGSATQYQRPYNSYPLPAMGSLMPSMMNGQMPMNGGMSTGMMSGYQGMNTGYGMHQQAHQSQAMNDRPFKCDVCVQSFNRNHDLKRHKRIHLAVKPFPCGHCDKSFSRKDALKVSFIRSFCWDQILMNIAETYSCQRL